MRTHDQDLIRGFLAGKAAQVQEVDRWIGAAVKSFRARLGHCWEDLLQDIRLEMLRRFQSGEFRGESELKTYVWRIAVHAAITRVRRNSLRDHQGMDGVPPPADAGQSVLDAMLHREKGLLALRILDEAASPCRDIWRRILDGHSYEAMSREMGITAGALRVRVRRCRQLAGRMRERLLAASSVDSSEPPKGEF